MERLIFYHDHDILNSRKSLLRWLNKLPEADLKALLHIKIADNLGQHPRYLRVERFQNTLEALDRLLAEHPCFDRSGLAVRGSDLLPLGYQGKEIGQALDRLVAAVIDGKSENKKEVLLDFLKQSQK